MDFLKKLHEANEFLEQPIFLFSVIDEFRNKQHSSETFAVEKVKRLNNPHHWFFELLLK